MIPEPRPAPVPGAGPQLRIENFAVIKKGWMMAHFPLAARAILP
jgi:hypothetical protein